jgi:lysozyme
MFPLLKSLLIQHEGLRLEAYTDTVGKLTIGVGHNIDDDPEWPKGKIKISEHEAMLVLRDDMEKAVTDCYSLIPRYSELSCTRKAALADMAFNLGRTRLGKFKKMLAAIENDDWLTASEEALDSKWATQVGHRADTLATLLRGDW